MKTAVRTLTDEQARELRVLREGRYDVMDRMRDLPTDSPLRRALEAEHARLVRRSREIVATVSDTKGGRGDDAASPRLPATSHFTTRRRNR